MIKSILRKAVNAFGYEIRKKNQRDVFAIRQTFDEALYHLKTLGFYPDLVIDVGAADGTPPLQNIFPDSRFFWIEPLREFEPALKRLQETMKGEYVITGVGKEEGNFVLHVHSDLHGSTIFNEADGESADGTPRTISITTLNKIGSSHKWNQYYRILLKLDVQGFELEVLKGASDIMKNVEVVFLEVSFFRFLKNAPEFNDVVSFMKEIGYVAYDIVSGINRPLDYALGQKDLVFVKENGLFRRSHGWAK